VFKCIENYFLFGALITKEVFITELVLAIPDLDKEMRVEANILDYVIGEVLSVKHGDEK